MNIQVVSLILGSIGTLGSLTTGFIAFIRSRTNISTEIQLFHKNPSGCLLMVTFINKSYMSVSITDVRLVINKTRFSCVKIPEMALERTHTCGNKTDLIRRDFTMDFPINLPSLSGTSGYLAFRIPQETLQSVSTEVIVELSTNRRRIRGTRLLISDLPTLLSR